jgi:nicotinamide-nucleotide amidase
LLYFKELKFFGIGESALAEKCQHLLDLNDPTVAPLTAEAECRLRIATKAANQDLADQKINTVEEQIRQIAGEFIYGENEDTLESVVAELLKKRGETIALAESCTGGLLSKRLTDVPGSSQFIKCNLVTYSNESKQKLLKVPGELLQQKGAVDPEVAIAMASGAKELAQTNWGLGITGIAGPDVGSEEKPVGLVYVAIVGANDYKKVLELRLGQRSRQDVRWVTSQEALNLVRKELLHDIEKVL